MGSTFLMSVAAVMLLGMAGGAQTQPRFAVISIKAVAPGTPVFVGKPGAPGPVYPGGKYMKRRANLWQLLSFAYPQCDVPGKTLIGLPEWGSGFRDAFDVEAEAAPGMEPTLAQMRLMMQALLADRFGLKVHMESRAMPVYFMTVAKGGVRNITPSKAGDEYAAAFMAARRGAITVEARAVSMSDVAANLWLRVGRPVIDHTGMDGTYDIQEVTQAAASPAPEDFVSVLKDKLGLVLVPGDAKVPVMVIDHVQRPSSN